MTDTVAAGGTATISLDVVQTLLDILAAKNYEVVGPTVRDDAIVYDRIARLADLPAGWTDRQEAGRYRLERRDDGALFGFTVGPQAWKRFLHRPVETLWTMRQDRERRHGRKPASSVAPKFAFIGVRACELHAIAIQDRVFLRRTLSRILAYAHAAPGCFHRCRQLRPGRRNLLLRFDADRAEGRRRLRPRAHRAPRRRRTTNSWSRSAAKRAPDILDRAAAPPRHRCANCAAAAAVVARTQDQMGRQPGDRGSEGAAAEQPRLIRAGMRSPSAA